MQDLPSGTSCPCSCRPLSPLASPVKPAFSVEGMRSPPLSRACPSHCRGHCFCHSFGLGKPYLPPLLQNQRFLQMLIKTPGSEFLPETPRPDEAAGYKLLKFSAGSLHSPNYCVQWQRCVPTGSSAFSVLLKLPEGRNCI